MVAVLAGSVGSDVVVVVAVVVGVERAAGVTKCCNWSHTLGCESRFRWYTVAAADIADADADFDNVVDDIAVAMKAVAAEGGGRLHWRHLEGICLYLGGIHYHHHNNRIPVTVSGYRGGCSCY
jgi:hypothetical protein